jgi:hypothetical protein
LLLVGQGQDITSFFKSNSLLQFNPDDRLPYTLEALQQLLGQKKVISAINHFLEKQWEFAIDIFQNNMVFR